MKRAVELQSPLIIDDALLREAKHRAAERDLTVSDVVNEALRDVFGQEPPAAPPFQMLTYGSPDRRVTHTPADYAADAELDYRGPLSR